MQPYPYVYFSGDSAVTVEFGDRIAPEIHDRVLAFVRAVEELHTPGVIEVVPTYRSATVYVDPTVVDVMAFGEKLKRLAHSSQGTPLQRGNLLEVPVVYGGEFGPDLEALAEAADLREDQVVALHASADYRVYMLGFSPGFPYLGTVPEPIAKPRLKEPRIKVPAGSVGIAESQTGIYPQESPGGWRIIGRTPLKLFDLHRPRPCLLAPGDRVRFVPMNRPDVDQVSRADEFP